MQITKHKNKLVPEMITIACQFGLTHSGWVWIAADRVLPFFGWVPCTIHETYEYEKIQI